MPCYSIDETGIKVSANTDPKLLAKALRELDYTVTETGRTLRFSHARAGRSGTFENGELTVKTSMGAAVDQSEIRRAYSAQVVMMAAKRFGWQVKQESPTKFQVIRRA